MNARRKPTAASLAELEARLRGHVAGYRGYDLQRRIVPAGTFELIVLRWGLVDLRSQPRRSVGECLQDVLKQSGQRSAVSDQPKENPS